MVDAFEERDARRWAAIAHASAFVGLLGIPFGHVLGPLVVWLVKREDHPLIEECGREALNFQVTMTIALLVTIALMFVIIGFFLMPVVIIADIVLTIVATVAALDGRTYRYPFTLRLFELRAISIPDLRNSCGLGEPVLR